jgi:hypothetical protein
MPFRVLLAHMRHDGLRRSAGAGGAGGGIDGDRGDRFGKSRREAQPRAKVPAPPRFTRRAEAGSHRRT